MNTKSVMVMVMGAMVVMGPTLGCDCNCDPPDPMESGDYIINPPGSGNIQPGDDWVVGGELHVDREAHVATIRYTREGTTYEVHYTLEQ